VDELEAAHGRQIAGHGVSQDAALQWYRAALGRKEFAEDACSLTDLRQSVAESGGDIRQLILALVRTDGFLYRSGVVE
ncbi:MAG TPA: DUF1585 domain-containing protein, partial [Polyangiaceae bacterium]|nr:DUF1585 domain-containing protein [Polyangiaceae bacterium]